MDGGDFLNPPMGTPPVTADRRHFVLNPMVKGKKR